MSVNEYECLEKALPARAVRSEGAWKKSRKFGG
jgi:hypothetical protein